MSTSTIEQTIIPNCRFTGSGIKLRIFLPESFITSDGIPLQSSNPQVNRWYKEVDCTLVGDDLTIPEFEIDSTTDGIDFKTKRYVAYFFRGKTSLGVYTGFEGGFKVPPPQNVSDTLTWAELRTYNFSISYPPGDISGFYTKDQVNYLIAQGGGAASDAKYIVQVADPDLPNAQSLGLLSTGLVKNTTTTGVLSIGLAGTDYQSPLTAGVDYLAPSGSGSLLTALNATQLSSGTVPAARMPALTGDITSSAGAVATTLATVNSNVGSFTNANITVNAKGLVTAASNGTGGAGSVSSVAMTVPTFLSVSGSPITTSGTLAVSLSGTALPIANGGTGSTSQNFVDLTTGQTVAGIKTLTSVPIFISNVAADGAQGATTTMNMFKGADSTSGSPLSNNNPSTYLQTFRSGGTNGVAMFGFLNNFNLSGTAAADTYVNYTLARYTQNMSGATTGDYFHEIGRFYGILSPTNVNVGGTHNIHLYAVTAQAERTVTGVGLVGVYAEIRNSILTDASTSVGSINRTSNIVTSVSFAGGTGAHGTNLIYSEGINSATSAYAAWEFGANSIVQRGIDFTGATATLQGTAWAATSSSASVTIASGGHADVEVVQGSWLLINSTWARALSATANAITLTGLFSTFGGSTGSSLTITKAADAMWLRENQPIMALNHAGTSRNEVFRYKEDDTLQFDFDAKGSYFGNRIVAGNNLANRAIIQTVTSGSDYPGIWFLATATSPSLSNYAFLADVGSNITALNGPTAGGSISFRINNTEQWAIDVSGDFVAGTDNTDDIGNSGALRPRTVYAGTSLIAPVGTFATSVTTPIAYGGSSAGSTLSLLGTSGTAANAAFISMNPMVAGAFPGTVFIGAPTTSTLTAAGFSDVLHLQGADTVIPLFVIDSYGSAIGSSLTFRHANGTAASPTSTAAGNTVANFGGRPYTTSGTPGFAGGNRSAITFRALENITDTAQGMYVSIEGTPKGSTSRRQIEYIGIDTALTDGSAVSLFEVALTSGTVGGGTIEWAITVTNGTDHQAFSGVTAFSAVNKAGTFTTSITNPDGSAASTAVGAKAVSSGTLTAAWTILDGSNKVTIQLNADTSLTSLTTFKVYYKVISNSTSVITLV